MRDVFALADRTRQERRDQGMLDSHSGEGSAIILADRRFREWLWGYDAIEAAENVSEKMLWTEEHV